MGKEIRLILCTSHTPKLFVARIPVAPARRTRSSPELGRRTDPRWRRSWTRPAGRNTACGGPSPRWARQPESSKSESGARTYKPGSASRSRRADPPGSALSRGGRFRPAFPLVFPGVCFRHCWPTCTPCALSRPGIGDLHHPARCAPYKLGEATGELSLKI